MLAKHKKLPNIAGLTERPAPIKSGKPLKERVKICYRSELYMQEQQKNVVMFQEQLRQALNDLKTAKPDSLLFHTSRVEELKVKGDEMIIILQICGKINRELVYARQDLLKAVETGADSKVINKRRKRVQWLESKLEQIILQHSPARQDDNDDEQIDMDSADRSSDLGHKQSAMSSYPPDMSRLQTADSNGRLNTAGTGGSQFQVSVNGAIQDIGIIGASLGGNRLVLNGGTQDVIAEQQSREDQYEFTPSLSRGMSLSASQARLTQSKLSFREPIEDDIHSVDNRPDTSQFGDKEDSGGYDDDVDDEEEGGTESDRDYGDTSGNKSRVSQMSAVSSLFTDVTDEAARRTRRSQRSKPRTQQDVTQRPGVTREPSRVTVKSPLPPTTFVKAGRDDGHGEEYWMSEHHRVEFSALAPFLEEMDPNSLHQVAIAVPGNYVRKPSSGRHATLPWREVEDNRDINREALDRLSNQILSIQDKVYEAAIKSVDSLGARMQTRASRRDFSSMAKSRVGRSAMPSRQNQTTILSMPGLPGDQEENDNRYTPMVHMKYYSKEIPKAKVLPISRVNRNRVYPQSLTAFAFPDPDGRPAPERLVNQGRLYNDTKLVIYRAPNRKRPDTIKVKRVVTTTTQPGSPTKSNPLSQSAPNMLNKTHGAMECASFGFTDASNRKKREVKVNKNFSRAPLLDYDVMVKSDLAVGQHRERTHRLTKMFNRCTMCHSNPCELGCPTSYKVMTSESGESDTDSDEDGKRARPKCPAQDRCKSKAMRHRMHSNELQFVESLRKIKSRNIKEQELIRQWRVDRKVNPTNEELERRRARSAHSRSPENKAVTFKTLGAVTLLPKILLQPTHESKLTRPRNKPPHLSTKKKISLERKAAALNNKERARQEREDNLPHKPEKCSHETKKYKYNMYGELDSSLPEVGKSKFHNKKRKASPKSSVCSTTTGSYQQVIPKVYRRTGGIKGYIGKFKRTHATRTTSSETKSHSGSVIAVRSVPQAKGLPLTRASLSDSHRIVITVTKTLRNNKPGTVLPVTIKRKKDEITTTIKDDCDFCQNCGALPCLLLDSCVYVRQHISSLPTLRKDSFKQRTAAFVFIFGEERIRSLSTKIGRNKRNKTLGRELRLHPEVCHGLEHCRTCIEDELYSRAMTDHQNKLIKSAEVKAIALESLGEKLAENRKNPSSISLRTASKMAYALGAINKAKVDTPKTYHSGLKWDRVQYLYKHSLKSGIVEERQDAAKQLGLLGCDDPAVYHSLKNAIVEDSDERVQYEAAKSLISLGCLEDELVQILVDYLIVGNPEVRLDMLKTLCNARGISYISKSMPSFDELVKVLAHLCKPLDNADLVSFEAAIAFGKICVKNIHAVDKMFSYLNTGDDTHKKAVALRILVKQFNECSWNLVEVVLKQFTKSPVWEHRREAAQLLQHLGRKYTCSTHEDEELVYSILERRLWDDSVEMVRMESANTLGVLNMYGRAAETVIKRLSDSEPSVRAHAVTSLGTLGIKQPKVLRVLSEMLELDPSDTVRREIIRAFGSMQLTDKKIIRLLKERERGDGMLAQEAKRVLKVLEAAS